MHPQLRAIANDLEAATHRLHALAQRTPAEWWTRRVDPDRWSVGECVAHLNLTSRAFLPHFRRALDDPALRSVPAPARFRMGFLARMLYLLVGPVPSLLGVPLGIRVRTSGALVPAGDLPKEASIAEFEQLQREVLDVLRESDGRPLHRMRIASPVDARAGYNMYGALAIVPRHQHRHLQQAEAVAASFPADRPA